MSKIYTKSGDKGTTSLIGGERVSKFDVRVEAYGSVDELGAHVAMLGDMLAGAKLDDLRRDIVKISCDLMTIEALLAVGKGGEDKVTQLDISKSLWLEERIDAMSQTLPEISKFTIPGGNVVFSQCHICRTVCRRAERQVLRVAQEHSVSNELLIYLNRLSDYLYTLGRTISNRLKVEEILWQP